MKNDYFLIKSLRADEFCFFRKFVRTISSPFENQELRHGAKKTFTVTGRGVYLRVEKKAQYSETQKKGFSKPQSTSLGTKNFIPYVFGHNAERMQKLVGVIIEAKDTLLSDRLYLYDGGTVGRPYDFFDQKFASVYYKTKTNPQQKKLFHLDELSEFKQAIQNLNSEQRYNEVLARIRWNTDQSSKIFIYSDNLESRLIAQDYARILKESLLKNPNPNMPVNDQLEIPICFYSPSDRNTHLKNYSKSDQEKDCELAENIFQTDQKYKKYQEKNYEFLLGIKNVKEALTSKYDDNYLILKILNDGYVHIVQSLLDKVDNNYLKELTKLLVDKNQFSNCSNAIYYAARSEDNRLLDWLLENTPQEIRQDLLDKALATSTSEKDNWSCACINLLVERGASTTVMDNEKNTLLHIAADHVDHRLAKKLINLNMNIEARNIRGKTPLFSAIENNDEKLVELLLEKNKISSKSNHHQLMAKAIERNNIHIVRMLLDNGVDITHKNENGESFLHLAVYHNKLDILAYLLKRGASLNGKTNSGHTALHFAAQQDNTRAIELLVASKANIEEKDSDGNTALYSALSGGNKDTAKLLIDFGAQINVSNNTGSTPLHAACNHGLLEIVKLLLVKKVDVNAVNSQDETALHTAVGSINTAMSNNIEIVRLLLESGAEINNKNAKPILVTGYLYLNSNIELFNLLIKAGADVNVADKQGNTPLLEAIGSGNENLLDLFLKQGASIKISNNSGETPLHFAAKMSNSKIIKLLLKLGAEINSQDQNGDMPLHLAIRSGKLENVILLLNKSPDINLQNKEGFAPIHLAAMQPDNRILELVLNHHPKIDMLCSDKTALHYATISGFPTNIELLLKNGASTEIKDKDNQRAIDYVYHFDLPLLNAYGEYGIAPGRY